MTEREQRAFDEWVLQAYRQHASIKGICQAASQRYPREASPYHIQAALDRAQRTERLAVIPAASASGRGKGLPLSQRLVRA